jgi:hypothetical protein
MQPEGGVQVCSSAFLGKRAAHWLVAVQQRLGSCTGASAVPGPTRVAPSAGGCQLTHAIDWAG